MEDWDAARTVLMCMLIISIIHYFLISKINMHPTIHLLMGFVLFFIIIIPVENILHKIFK